MDMISIPAPKYNKGKKVKLKNSTREYYIKSLSYHMEPGIWVYKVFNGVINYTGPLQLPEFIEDDLEPYWHDTPKEHEKLQAIRR
jgi:hypothetical protein